MATIMGNTPRFVNTIQAASLSQIVTAVLTILVVKWICRGIYRVYFHPLSHFPGPNFSAFTRIPQIFAAWSGSTHRYTKKLHDAYGNIVRMAPDELSIMGPTAMRDIYGHGTKGTRGSPPPKHWPRYGRPANGTPDIMRAKNADHTRMRRIFTPAFSDRALKQQEPLFMKYVDKLVSSLRRGLEKDSGRKFDMVRMYNFATFDVMGDLAFGESLHMLDKSEYASSVSLLFESLKIGNRLSILHYYPLLNKTFRALRSVLRSVKRPSHSAYSADRVTKRLEQGKKSESGDLWDLVLKQEEGKGLSREEMDSNSSLFMLAGTETTATLLSGLTYLLLKNPEPMKKLVGEVRTSFSSPTPITLEAIAGLPYLNACLKEALRLYPPVAIGFPRLTPEEGSTICGEYIPPGTTIRAPNQGMYTSPKFFKDPLSFIPERWLGDERYATDQRAIVQPFSVGSNDCLGKNMAYHEMRLIMTHVLYNFDFELCVESTDWMNQNVFLLWEKPPLIVTLKDTHAS